MQNLYFLKHFIINYVSVCGCVQVLQDARVSEPPGAGAPGGCESLMWVLRTELGTIWTTTAEQDLGI